MSIKTNAKQRRSYRTRNKLRTVNIERNSNREIRPRLSIHRTGKQIYAQVIDDIKGTTVAAASSLDKDLKLKHGGNADAAKKVGDLIAKRAKKAGVKKVVFDRGRFIYHGRVKSLAEGAREGGLEF